jgi:hypothetical protein
MMLFVISALIIGVPTATITLQDANAAIPVAIILLTPQKNAPSTVILVPEPLILGKP